MPYGFNNRSFVKGGPYFEDIFVIAGEARFRGRTLLGKDTLARRCAGFAVCDFNELRMARGDVLCPVPQWLASGSHSDRPLCRIDVIEADATFAAPLFFIALQLPDSDNLDFVTPV